MDYTIWEWFCVFVIYAVIGWCLEVGYVTVDTGKFVNRGFLNGPVCPIYGFGGTIVIAVLYPYKQNILLVYIGAVILSTVLEYITGFILEKIFHEHWWDYSDIPFNIKGYVCLKFSLLWGVCCVLVVKVVHPPIDKLISYLPNRVECICSIVFAIAFVADLVVTVAAIVKWKRQMVLMNEIVEILRGFSDEVGDNISSAVQKAMEKSAEWKDVFEKDEKYLEIKAEFESKKQEAEALREKYMRIRKTKSFSLRRLQNAFPRLRMQTPTALKQKWREGKKRG